jgi:hypothetical protein
MPTLAAGGLITGVVTSTQPSNHLFCTYSYKVDGRLYEKNSGGRPKGVTVGSPIRVKYLPRNPNVAAVGDYISDTDDSLVGGTAFVLLICTLFAIVVGRLAYWRFTRKRGCAPPSDSTRKARRSAAMGQRSSRSRRA